MTTFDLPAAALLRAEREVLVEWVRRAYAVTGRWTCRHAWYSPNACCPMGALALAVVPAVGDRVRRGHDDLAEAAACDWAMAQFGPEWVTGFIDGYDGADQDAFRGDQATYDDGFAAGQYVGRALAGEGGAA